MSNQGVEDEIDDKNFQTLFEEIDTDKSGTVEKDEIKAIITKMLGGKKSKSPAKKKVESRSKNNQTPKKYK